jgi:steroid 5-alpha reductase family enzyme
MATNLNRILTIALWALMAISAVFLVFFYFGKVVPGTEDTQFVEPVITETFLLWAYILLGLAILFSVAFPIIRMVTDPKNALKTLIGVAGMVIVVAIMYLLASDEVLVIARENPDNVPSTLKWVGAGLNTMYVMFVLAVIAILYSEINKVFK